MRSTLLLLACTAVTAIGVLAVLPAHAQDGYTDHVYADSMGNLVVDSAAGYKRIIVGQGERARELSKFTQAGQPKVIYLDNDDDWGPERCGHRPYGSQNALRGCR